MYFWKFKWVPVKYMDIAIFNFDSINTNWNERMFAVLIYKRVSGSVENVKKLLYRVLSRDAIARRKLVLLEKCDNEVLTDSFRLNVKCLYRGAGILLSRVSLLSGLNSSFMNKTNNTDRSTHLHIEITLHLFVPTNPYPSF